MDYLAETHLCLWETNRHFHNFHTCHKLKHLNTEILVDLFGSNFEFTGHEYSIYKSSDGIQISRMVTLPILVLVIWNAALQVGNITL